MTRIYDIADEYVERFAALNPIGATSVGVSGHDAEMTDFSPQGAEARANLDRETIASLEAASAEGERDRIAREAMIDELRVGLDTFDAGEHLRDLNILGSPLQSVRMAFDLMPRESEEQWRNIASRLRLVPQGLASHRESLQEGMRQGKVSSRRALALVTCHKSIDLPGNRNSEAIGHQRKAERHNEVCNPRGCVD